MTIARLFFVLLLIGFAPAPAGGAEGQSIEGRILESQVMVRQGDFQQAREVLEQAVAGAPGEPRLYLHLGNVYRELGWMGEAAAAYQKAVRIHPGYSGAFDALAALYRHMEKWDEAIAAYRQLAAIDPSAARPHFEMAMIYRQQGLGEEGRRELQQAYRLNPQFVVQSARLQHVALDEPGLRQAAGIPEDQADGEAPGGIAAGPGQSKRDLPSGNGGQAAAADVGQNDAGLPGAEERPGYAPSAAALLLLAWAGWMAWKGRREFKADGDASGRP